MVAVRNKPKEIAWSDTSGPVGGFLRIPGGSPQSGVGPVSSPDGSLWNIVVNDAGVIGSSLKTPAIPEATRLFNFEQGVLDPAFTFARSDTATYRANGGLLSLAGDGEPRFNFALNGVSEGFLGEPADTNFLFHSEDFTQAQWANWGGGTITTPDNTIAPDGTLTADKLEREDSAADGKSQSRAYTNDAVYTVSVFVRNDDAVQTQLLLYDNVAGGNHSLQNFTWSNGVPSVGTSGGTSAPTAAGVEDWGNGWWRLWFTGVMPTNASNMAFVILPANGGGDVDGNGGWYWGAMVEEVPGPSSYIKSGSASGTRNADSLTSVGAGFSDWWNAAEGTVLLDIDLVVREAGAFAMTIDDNTNANRFLLQQSAGQCNLLVQASSATVANLNAGAWLDGRRRIAFAYASNDFALTSSEITVVNSDPSGAVPAVSQLTFGATLAGTFQDKWKVRNLTYWNKRLSDETLLALSRL